MAYIRYNNAGATRNRPLADDLTKRLQFLESMGITAEVFSGGQPSKAEGGARVGSERHDHGGAGDMFLYKGDRKLDWANPEDRVIFEEVVRRGKANGIKGWGAGEGYMQPGSIHVGGGNEGVWGKDGKGANAADWLVQAYNGAKSGNPDVIAEVVAAANQPGSIPTQTPPILGQAMAQAQPTPEEPKSHNGILVDAYNKITGSNVQMPDKIFGADTDKVAKGFAGLGDFAKAISENDSQINNTIQASARAGAGRSSAPVELSMRTSFQPMTRKKKKGALSGLGGYIV